MRELQQVRTLARGCPCRDDSEPAHLVKKRRPRNAEAGCSGPDNAVASAQNTDDVSALGVFKSDRIGVIALAWVLQFIERRLQRDALRKDHRTLNKVFQFANVSGPRMAHQSL